MCQKDKIKRICRNICLPCHESAVPSSSNEQSKEVNYDGKIYTCGQIEKKIPKNDKWCNVCQKDKIKRICRNICLPCHKSAVPTFHPSNEQSKEVNYDGKTYTCGQIETKIPKKDKGCDMCQKDKIKRICRNICLPCHKSAVPTTRYLPR